MAAAASRSSSAARLPLGVASTPPRRSNGKRVLHEHRERRDRSRDHEVERLAQPLVSTSVFGTCVDHLDAIEGELGDDGLEEVAAPALRLNQHHFELGRGDLHRQARETATRTDIGDARGRPGGEDAGVAERHEQCERLPEQPARDLGGLTNRGQTGAVVPPLEERAIVLERVSLAGAELQIEPYQLGLQRL